MKTKCAYCKKNIELFISVIKVRNYCNRICYYKNRSILLKSKVIKSTLPQVLHGKNNPMYGKKHSDSTKRKIGIYSSKRKNNLNKIFSENWRKNMSKSMVGRISPRKGIKLTQKIKKKMRESAIKYIKSTVGIFRPRIGKYEKRILDELELSFKYEIKRQFCIDGFFLDGYIPELNLAIEVDEPYHKYLKLKDKERENYI